MADVFSKEKRSAIMSKVRSKQNRSTELRFITLLQQENIHGWTRNYPVKGHPDFVFMRQHIAVFIDGCFWHGHNCRNTIPANNKDYWDQKRARNIQHDDEVTEMFQKRGWTVVRIWECELRKKSHNVAIEKIKEAMKKTD
ncbi:MAG: very short patch repair endonuclease [Clostridia bacterium]